MLNMDRFPWIDELVERIRERNARRVLLQLPEGLKFLSPEIIDELEKRGIEAYSWMEPTYGACDVVPEAAEQLGLDLLVHIGHVRFYRPVNDGNVLYFPIDIPVDAERYRDLLSSIPEDSVLVITSVQHLSSLGRFVDILRGMGKEARSGGYVLGCLFPRVEEDAVLFIGSGEFHPSGIPALSLSEKPVYVLDIERNELRRINSERWERKRMARIAKAIAAERFGIIVSVKHGQKELLGLAAGVKKRLEGMGKRVYILAMNHVSDWKLEGLSLDCLVNTACPRIADDAHSIPMINATDIDELERIWREGGEGHSN